MENYWYSGFKYLNLNILINTIYYSKKIRIYKWFENVSTNETICKNETFYIQILIRK